MFFQGRSKLSVFLKSLSKHASAIDPWSWFLMVDDERSHCRRMKARWESFEYFMWKAVEVVKVLRCRLQPLVFWWQVEKKGGKEGNQIFFLLNAQPPPPNQPFRQQLCVFHLSALFNSSRPLPSHILLLLFWSLRLENLGFKLNWHRTECT